MGVNKVVFGNSTVIDITDSTITSERIVTGYTGYAADGSKIVGSLTAIPLDPYVYDQNCGYISNGNWIYENPTQTYIDIYEVVADHTYFITLGGNVGTRFRTMFTTTDISKVTSGTVAGTKIKDVNNPPAYSNVTYKPTTDGYIAVAKDNIGKSGVISYVYDANASWV